MKVRFNTYDLVCSITELQRLVGMRVNQIYDIDHRTYLIRLQRSEEKCILLLESGNRIHTTAFDWPKNVAPSGFSMKMRKHLKNKRLESLTQVGVDRILDLQFGIGEAAYHIILELYDRGNIVLTDYTMTILNILRPHTEDDKIRFAVKEKYPLNRARQCAIPSMEEIERAIKEAKTGDNLKKILNPRVEFGPAIIDHILLKVGLRAGCKIGKDFKIPEDMPKLTSALELATEIFDNARKNVSKGYIIQKKEIKPSTDGTEEYIFANVEFHSMLFEQIKDQPYKEFETFDLAVDEYFSTMEGQKLDLKALQQEREAVKKLENVRKDHSLRLIGLEESQELDKIKAELIMRNQTLVDNTITAIRSALANQISWSDIQVLLKEAQSKGDSVALTIKGLKLETNHITVLLSDPYEDGDETDTKLPPTLVDVDLAHHAYGNATKYFNKKRSAAKKQQKTIESQCKALKSAEKKAKQTLKEVQAIHGINKARKVYWFEKFYWFISSENYLVIGGRDQQQNELIVKRYLRTGDLYVHADLTGASSIVIKNPSSDPVPPKTLAEAGTMAVAYSVAWEAKVVVGAWWVNSDQVSKTAPTGEYLTTGSFMIRGKKNYLPPYQLVMGLGFLFRLEDSSIERHKDERRVRTTDEDSGNVESAEFDKEIELEGDSDDDDSIDKTPLETIEEEGVETERKIDERNKGVDLKDNIDEQTEQLYPDTQIKIDLSGPRMKIQVDNKSLITTQNQEHDIEDKEGNVFYLGDDKPITLKPNVNKKKKSPAKVHWADKGEEKNEKQTGENKPNVLKRGQKGRLKKMKEKYKDQDEEDRRLSMEILKSAGAAKEDKRKNANKNVHGSKQQGKKKNAHPKVEVNKQVIPEGDQAEEEDAGPGPDVDMLDQLTGKPVQEDELLFAVPVVAPYNTLQSYKFKVKLTPGTGRRGKAAKTAVAVFLRDKVITLREKDLLKAVKEESIARNIPGKVKISAPQIQKLRK
ncbi:nuclear export mediator factor NEMF homolog [Orussus abietinus]|uniref:nuclear export mediator factor NEMF homolog n=1 Tax=Orussus abietinus TaxID=222816 RepID=UPI000626D831|nr:nuclear export mediator factor NEMF homolog [Orussus abietinus]